MNNGFNAVLPIDYKRLAHTSHNDENNGYEESQRKMWVKDSRARIQGVTWTLSHTVDAMYLTFTYHQD